MDKRSLFEAVSRPHIVAHRIYYEFYRNVLGNGGVCVYERDWDNLLILDACRYDVFFKACDIEGELTHVISQGSHTVEFFRNNFGTGTFYDTVYVTATPQLQWVGLSDVFYETDHVWIDGWDEAVQTVPPDIVSERAHEAVNDNPSKRLIVHFVQPHFPFIGEQGDRISERIDARSGIDGSDWDLPTVWDHLRDGTLSKREVWDAYRENLDIVLDKVESLLDNLPGKTVITSDHGNAFGEYGLYGHPGKKATKPLIRVPWLMIESNDRRETVAEEPAKAESDGHNREVLKDRLADLGYR